MFRFRYLGVDSKLSGPMHEAGIDGQLQMGAGVIGPASAERNCKSSHLTPKQQAICARSPPVLQVNFRRANDPQCTFSLSRNPWNIHRVSNCTAKIESNLNLNVRLNSSNYFQQIFKFLKVSMLNFSKNIFTFCSISNPRWHRNRLIEIWKWEKVYWHARFVKYEYRDWWKSIRAGELEPLF